MNPAPAWTELLLVNIISEGNPWTEVNIFSFERIFFLPPQQVSELQSPREFVHISIK